MSGMSHVLRTSLALTRHNRASQAELRAFQDAALRRLLVHAYERVPYYRKLLQERPDRIVLRIQPVAGPVSEQVSAIERSVRPLLGPGVDFGVQLLDEIPLESSGKFRVLRSLVQPDA